MKVVFNFIAGWVLLLLVFAAATPAHADTFWTTRDLLADFFRASTRVTYQRLDLKSGDLRTRVEARLGYALPRDSYTIFVATTGERVDGYAVIDDELGEHLPITFAVKLNAVGVVERQEIVAYREPRGDEVRDERFRRQFQGKSARDRVRAGDDVVTISGATISSRSMAVGVKRALVLVDEGLLRSMPIPAASVRR